MRTKFNTRHNIPGRQLIKKIGGRLETDYFSLRRAVEEMNDKYIRLLDYFNLMRYDDAENVILALLDGVKGICGYFVESVIKDIQDGKVDKAKILNAKWIVGSDVPPGEEREKRLKKEDTELRRTLKAKYNIALKEYRKDNYIDIFGINYYDRHVILKCLSTLYLEEYGVEIDAKKFIAFYTDFMKASESIIGDLHRKAAEALNKFFGGAVPITEKEIERYFSFKNGIVEPNEESITLESYSRLGMRTANVTNTEEDSL